jgi:hypothetical protein
MLKPRNNIEILTWLVSGYLTFAEVLSLEASKWGAPCLVISKYPSTYYQFDRETCAPLHEGIKRALAFFSEHLSHDNITAAATVCIAIFTYTLWRSTHAMWLVTNQSLRVANMEFASTHRPRITLRRIKPILPFKPNSPAEALIEAVNVGDTNATIFEIGVVIYIANQPFNPRPAPVPIVVIKPGIQSNLNVKGQRQISQSQIANLGASTGPWMRMIGVINYKDDNGAIRTTSFARYYSTTLNRFVEVPADDSDEDLEYEN